MMEIVFLLLLFCHIASSALPSVSLLQKTPSSPVSCHATGFYPDRAVMFWRKDGEELHEDVEHGEILPSHNGTFQMSVDLNISSVTPKDWGRYECVFQLSDTKENITIKLDKAVIKSNWNKAGIRHDRAPDPPYYTSPFKDVGALIMLVICILAIFICKQDNDDE